MFDWWTPVSSHLWCTIKHQVSTGQFFKTHCFLRVWGHPEVTMKFKRSHDNAQRLRSGAAEARKKVRIPGRRRLCRMMADDR